MFSTMVFSWKGWRTSYWVGHNLGEVGHLK